MFNSYSQYGVKQHQIIYLIKMLFSFSYVSLQREHVDTLSITLQNGVVRLVSVLHGDGLWKFSQHPLLEVLETLIVITATDKLLVLQRNKDNSPNCVI